LDVHRLDVQLRSRGRLLRLQSQTGRRSVGGKEKEKRKKAACLRSYSRLLWPHSRSMREDEAKEVLANEVVRYSAE